MAPLQTVHPTKPKKVAIWLQLNPGQELVGEGIGMHLARLVMGMRDRNSAQAVICAPSWSKPKIDEWLWMYGIRDAVSVLYFGPQIREAKPGRKVNAKASPKVNDVGRLSGMSAWLVARSASSVHPMILLPFVALGGAGFLGVKLAARVARLFVRAGLSVVRVGQSRFTKLAGDNAYQAMAFHIDNDPSIESCIVPIGNWYLCRMIKKKPITVQIPDIVFLEFPEVFDKVEGVESATSSILRVAAHATRIICPSPYISEVHHQRLGIPERKSKVVYHAPMTADQYLRPLAKPGETLRETGARVGREFLHETNFGSSFERYVPPRMRPAEIRRIRSRLRPNGVIVSPDTSLNRFSGSIRWLTALSDNWERRDGLLYFPTQNRPYKNILRTLLAIDQLRSEGRNLILMLTGDLNYSPEIVDLIANRDLYGHVLCLPRMSAVLHGAMYTLADLTVAPSLFEGGFPFLFSESLSVDTPIVMADIPVTQDVLPQSLWEQTLFNPKEVSSIAEAIKRGLDRGPELLAAQKPFFDAQVARRDWGDVAQEYLDACDEGVAELALRAESSARQRRVGAQLEAQARDTGFLRADELTFD